MTKDVPPYAIVVGAPAQPIRYRFDDELIAQLQESEWWMLPDEKLKQFSEYMNDPESLCNVLKQSKLMVGKCRLRTCSPVGYLSMYYGYFGRVAA